MEALSKCHTFFDTMTDAQTDIQTETVAGQKHFPPQQLIVSGIITKLSISCKETF